MSATTLKRLTIPTAGDDLLGSWKRFADSAGVIVSADSVAAARIVLSRMETELVPISGTSPVYFDIGGVVYRCDGRKNERSWILSPLNEVEYDETTYALGWGQSLAQDQSATMMTSSLPARPYDRLLLVDGGIWGYSQSGHLDMELRVQGRTKLSRISSGDAHSVSASAQGIVRAGESPNITVSIRGGHGGGRGGLSKDSRFNYLNVVAFPITMNR